MRVLTPRGATLVELTVALSLSAVLALFLLSETGRQQRVVQDLAVRSAAVSTVETAAQVLRSELGGAEPGDLLAADPDRVLYRATRATGAICGLAPDGLRLSQAAFRGVRVPVPGRDSVMLPVADSLLGWRTDHRSINGPVRSEPCPDGAPGLVVPSSPGAGLSGVPIRVFEVMELRLYSSAGLWWLGARSVSSGETIQPVAGPLTSDGFVLQLLDADGMSTGSTLLARLVQVRLRAGAGDPSAVGGAVRGTSRLDSLTVLVRLGSGGP